MDYFDPGEGYDFDFDAFNFELPDIDFDALMDFDPLQYMYNPAETPAVSGTGLSFGNNATSLRDIFNSGEPGLKLPEAGNIDSMGGGQGLTIDTDALGDINPFWEGLPDGIATQNGIYRPDWLPALGDPASFINDQSRPINGAGQLIGGTGSLATGNQNPVQQGQAAAGNKPISQQIKDALNGNGGLNKAALAALAAYLLNKGDDKGSGGTFTAPNMNLQYQRGRVAQDPARRAGAANPGGYFTPVTYAAQGGLMAPARRMAAGGGIEGLLKGPGDGLSDDIPATIDGQDPAQLATGEFVVSADVVSALGGGDTDAGAKRLEQMMSRVRTQAHGTPKQTRPVSDKALPA